MDKDIPHDKSKIEDITISFVVTPKPIKLFDHLVNDRGFEVEEIWAEHVRTEK